MKGSGRGIIEMLSRYLPEGIKTQGKPQSV
jgi:hypothetical protein